MSLFNICEILENLIISKSSKIISKAFKMIFKSFLKTSILFQNYLESIENVQKHLFDRYLIIKAFRVSFRYIIFLCKRIKVLASHFRSLQVFSFVLVAFELLSEFLGLLKVFRLQQCLGLYRSVQLILGGSVNYQGILEIFRQS